MKCFPRRLNLKLHCLARGRTGFSRLRSDTSGKWVCPYWSLRWRERSSTCHTMQYKHWMLSWDISHRWGKTPLCSRMELTLLYIECVVHWGSTIFKQGRVTSDLMRGREGCSRFRFGMESSLKGEVEHMPYDAIQVLDVIMRQDTPFILKMYKSWIDKTIYLKDDC